MDLETNTERDLLAGDAGKAFLDQLSNLDPDTARTYTLWLDRFLEWEELDADQLFKKHWSNLSNPETPRDRLWLAHELARYQRYLRDSEGFNFEVDGELMATTTVLQPEKALVNFLESNGLDFPRNGEAIQIETVPTPNIEKPDLERMIGYTGSLKLKAVIKVGIDSGLRLSDLTRLTVGAFRNADRITTSNGEIYATFEWRTWKRIGRRRTRPYANPVLTPQAIEAVETWLDYRTETLGIPADDRSPLFCCERNKAGYTLPNGTEVSGTTQGNQLHDSTLSASFTYLRGKAKVPKNQQSGRYPTIHSLRVFNETALGMGGLRANWRLITVGKQGGAHSRYARPNPRELVEAFSKASWALRTDGRLTGEESGVIDKITKLETDTDYYKIHAERFAKENEELKARLEKLESKMEGFFSS